LLPSLRTSRRSLSSSSLLVSEPWPRFKPPSS
jgi:hypothetical protein